MRRKTIPCRLVAKLFQFIDRSPAAGSRCSDLRDAQLPEFRSLLLLMVLHAPQDVIEHEDSGQDMRAFI